MSDPNKIKADIAQLQADEAATDSAASAPATQAASQAN